MILQEFLLELEGEILICDGAIGTFLQAETNLPVEYLNIINPDAVKLLHKAYIDAGSDIITTNTFSANIPNLRENGLENLLEEIIRNGVKIAKEAAKQLKKRVYVA